MPKDFQKIAATPPENVKIAGIVTDMRRGMSTLALQAQQGIGRDPYICVGLEYVAARFGDTSIRGDGSFCRHILHTTRQN